MFCCFFPYCAVQKGNQGAGPNHAHIRAYRFVQTLYIRHSSTQQTGKTKLFPTNINDKVVYHLSPFHQNGKVNLYLTKLPINSSTKKMMVYIPQFIGTKAVHPPIRLLLWAGNFSNLSLTYIFECCCYCDLIARLVSLH